MADEKLYLKDAIAKAICEQRDEGCQCRDRPLCCNAEALDQAAAAMVVMERNYGRIQLVQPDRRTDDRRTLLVAGPKKA